ncbi:threonine/serine dehydratase [Sphingomonas sp. SUN039]|uniref:threonine ammonia-lyase n=1 Tax=Sphingomonas sp. SUN039 TaxID=2937787 RepID=UPI002164B1AA|nr:threonine/serine dehydratase [Sphingomonas sp. SUN039]UVO53869.1 threonine/serine dehydratase [Sphingomonas sp. SUN039]
MRNPSLSGVRDAADAVARIALPTPLLTFEVGGTIVFAKAESLQPMGAFKLRGAWWRLVSLSPKERARGVVAFSSGNHAQGIAWAAKRLGIAATIAMPSDAPAAKLAGTRVLGADIVLFDRATESREEIAAALAAERGATLVPSFDDPWVVEGQGSAGIEAATQMAALGCAPPDLVVACCGGGGLASGMALACPDARMIVVEPEGWDDMTRSLAAGVIVPVGPNPPPTACDALMTKRVAELTFGILRARGATGVAVSETEIEDAIRFAFRTFRLVIEPGGAVALAAILSGKVVPGERTLVTLSGGNIDPDQFAAILGRGQ